MNCYNQKTDLIVKKWLNEEFLQEIKTVQAWRELGGCLFPCPQDC